MRLVNVEAKNPHTKEAYKFVFGDINETNKPVAKNGAFLAAALADAFSGRDSTGFDVSADFLENDVVFNINKIVEGGEVKRSLRKLGADKNLLEAAEGGEINTYLRAVLGGDAAELIENSFLSAEEFDKFALSGDLGVFPKIGEMIREKQTELGKKLPEPVSQDELGAVEEEIKLRQDVFSKVKERYAALQEKLGESASYALTNELRDARDRLKELEGKRAFVEEKRKLLEEYESAKDLIPKLTVLRRLSEQAADLARQCEENKKELDWYESEYASVTGQLDEKQKALSKIIADRVAAQALSAQTVRAKELEEKNKKLNGQLDNLNVQMEALESQKINLKNSLGSIDEAINEIKSTMDEFAEPDKNFADLLESVRINAKMDELEAQTEKYRAEITVKESQVAERERLLATQTRQLRNIMDVDTAVSPYKAREAIMSVIDFKTEKLLNINASLKEKMRNLSRAREAANYQLTGIVQSEETIAKDLEKTRKMKGEEFKRQVLINSQKIYQDATAVYAVENDLDDEDVASLESLYRERTAEKQKTLEAVAKMTGALEEIQRHIDINQSEISNLNEERQGIIDRYNQLIHENTNETVSNYLRAIETDKGTNYLMEVGADAVRTETEIKDLRKTVENLRLKLADAETRLKQLGEARSIIEGDLGTMESMMHLNEQTKNELADIAVRLTAAVERQKTTLGRIDELDLKIARVREVIVETGKTVRVNEREIEYSARQTEKLAGGNVDKLLENARFNERETNAEITMLLGSKSTIESQLFDKKIAFKQLEWLKENKENELREYKEVLTREFAANNADFEWVEKMAAADVGQSSEIVAKYEGEVSELKSRVKNLAKLLSQSAPLDKELSAGASRAKAELAIAAGNLEKALARQKELLTSLAAATTAKRKTDARGRTAPKEVGEFLKRASVFSQEMAGVSLGYDDGLAVFEGEEKRDFIKLDKAAKLAVFLALRLAYPTGARAKPEFVILDDGLAQAKMKEYLEKLIGYTFVTSSRYFKPKEA